MKKNIKKYSWILLIIYFVLAWIYPLFGSIALICMLAPVLTSFWKKRDWCGNYCPRGSFNDNILSKISAKHNYPNFFKLIWFKIFILTIILIIFTFQILNATTLLQLGTVFFRMVLVTTLIAIVLGIYYKHRASCMICPMGTLASFCSCQTK
jgi:polyferredoxin